MLLKLNVLFRTICKHWTNKVFVVYSRKQFVLCVFHHRGCSMARRHEPTRRQQIPVTEATLDGLGDESDERPYPSFLGDMASTDLSGVTDLSEVVLCFSASPPEVVPRNLVDDVEDEDDDFPDEPEDDCGFQDEMAPTPEILEIRNLRDVENVLYAHFRSVPPEENEMSLETGEHEIPLAMEPSLPMRKVFKGRFRD